MIRFLQINLRKSGPARRLMEQTACELGPISFRGKEPLAVQFVMFVVV